MAKKSFLTRSAKERAKIQTKYVKRMDRWVNKRMKAFGRLWKKKLAGLVAKVLLVVAVAAGGFAAGKAAAAKLISGKKS